MFKYRLVGTDSDFMTTFIAEVRAWNRHSATRKAVRMAEERHMGEGTNALIVRRKGLMGWKTMCVVGHAIEFDDAEDVILSWK